MYNIFTLKDTRDSVTFGAIMTYAIVYQETVIKMIPLAPIALITFIFYNYYYGREFKRPPNTYIRNIKLVQALMSMTGDLFDFQYYVIEQCLFWKSKEKTLLTLNTLLLAFLATLPILLVPLRYIIVVGMWGGMAVNSPFAMAVGQAIFQILIEYGIVFERKAPILMN